MHTVDSIHYRQQFHRQQPIFRWLIIVLALCTTIPLTLHWSRNSEPTGQDSQSTNQPLPVAGNFDQQADAPALLYSSYVAGDGSDIGKDVAVDAAGNIQPPNPPARHHPLMGAETFLDAQSIEEGARRRLIRNS